MILHKIMSYLTEYTYGSIEGFPYPARKFMLTGRVDVYHENAWIKATPIAHKHFVEQTIEPASAVAPQHQAPPVTKKKVPMRRVNAATIAEEDEAPPLPEPDPLPVAKKGKSKKKTIAQEPGKPLTPAQARARAEQEQAELMRTIKPPLMRSTPKTEELIRQQQNPDVLGPLEEGDADALAARMDDLADILAEVQQSSASGFAQMRQVMVAMRTAAAEYRGDPIPEEEQQG